MCVGLWRPQLVNTWERLAAGLVWHLVGQVQLPESEADRQYGCRVPMAWALESLGSKTTLATDGPGSLFLSSVFYLENRDN